MSTWLNRCHFGDVRAVLREMIAAGVKVQCIVTSPPYWGLRDYGHPGQLGLEASLSEFLANQVEVFDLARQVLADDGTCWVNMGDSYAGSRSGPDTGSTLEGTRNNQNEAKKAKQAMTASRRRDDAPIPRSEVRVDGLKPKDLVGQPWRLAFALQDAGWWLRQDIIWHKPNPMPESVTDRFTKAHEYVFLLTKSARYYFDQEAVLEPVSQNTHARLSQDVQNQIGSARANGGAKTNGNMKAVARKHSGNGVGFGHGYDKDPKARVKDNASFDSAMAIMPTMRNRRSVWTIPTQSYSGAHFATFPEALVEPCILAGSRAGDTVLDIYFGSGTTGQVAQNLGRNWIGIEINEANRQLQANRLRQPGLQLEQAA